MKKENESKRRGACENLRVRAPPQHSPRHASATAANAPVLYIISAELRRGVLKQQALRHLPFMRLMTHDLSTLGADSTDSVGMVMIPPDAALNL